MVIYFSKTLTTEEKILQAAEQVFIEVGFDGARMQAIADKAEINKAMLHYYFRSKDTLFEKVFVDKIQHFFPKIGEELKNESSFLGKVELFIEHYITFLQQYPFLPLFVISTINKADKKQFIHKLPMPFLIDFFAESFQNDMAAGKIKAVNPVQFAMSVMGMCIFPFLTRPVFLEKAKIDESTFNMVMQQRIIEVKQYIRAILSK